MKLTNLIIDQTENLSKAITNNFEKATVSAHTRKTKSGKMVNVQEYEDKRQHHKSRGEAYFSRYHKIHQKFAKTKGTDEGLKDKLNALRAKMDKHYEKEKYYEGKIADHAKKHIREHKSSIKVIKDVARDRGHLLTDEEAVKHHKRIGERSGEESQDWYDRVKDYFNN